MPVELCPDDLPDCPNHLRRALKACLTPAGSLPEAVCSFAGFSYQAFAEGPLVWLERIDDGRIDWEVLNSRSWRPKSWPHSHLRRDGIIVPRHSSRPEEICLFCGEDIDGERAVRFGIRMSGNRFVPLISHFDCVPVRVGDSVKTAPLIFPATTDVISASLARREPVK